MIYSYYSQISWIANGWNPKNLSTELHIEMEITNICVKQYWKGRILEILEVLVGKWEHPNTHTQKKIHLNSSKNNSTPKWTESALKSLFSMVMNVYFMLCCYKTTRGRSRAQQRPAQWYQREIRHKLQNVAKQSLMTAIIHYVILKWFVWIITIIQVTTLNIT